MSVIKSETYRNYEIRVVDESKPVRCSGSKAAIGMRSRRRIYINEQEVTPRVNSIGADPDELIVKCHALIDDDIININKRVDDSLRD